MARVLLSAYACEPERGSEPAVGWGWMTDVARLGHEVTVLTRTANRPAIEGGLSHQHAAVNFLYYDLPHPLRRLRKGRLGKAVYYLLWQWAAARWLRGQVSVSQFDVVQHVTYVSARYPSFLGSLGVPFWFGPVSGGEVVPAPLRPGVGAGDRMAEWIRGLSNRLVSIDPLMRRTFRTADRLLVTPDTVRLLPVAYRHKAEVRLAIGLAADAPLPALRARTGRSGALHLLCVGRLLHWKGIDVALLAISRLKLNYPDVSLTVVGDGPAARHLRRLSRALGVERCVHWAGWKPQRALDEYYRSADLLLFPSLRDSGGMVVLEALTRGLPVVCCDLGGPGAIVDSTCGRVIATANCSREELSIRMADSVRELLAIPGQVESLSYGARARARQFRFADLVRSVYADPPVEAAVEQA